MPTVSRRPHSMSPVASAWAHDTGADLAKAANFTILRQKPYTVDARRLNEIEVIGTVYGGRWFPAATS